MTYYGASHLAAAFRTVRKNTVKIAEEIPEEQYGFRASEDTRTVAELLAHIALSVRFHQEITLSDRTNLDGFNYMEFVTQLRADAGQPRSKAALLDLLRNEGDRFAAQLDGLSEEFLSQVVTFPPGSDPASRTRFEMLLGVKEHEMHHRGQLMLLQRMLGVKPHLTRENEARVAVMLARTPAS